MTEQDLFAAIGQAEDRFLPEFREERCRRLPRHFGLIAAVLALIFTACAAPVVIRSFDKLQNGRVVASEHDKIWAYYTVYTKDGTILKEKETTLYESGDLEIQVEAAEDAPKTIEQYRLPMKLFDLYEAVDYSLEDGLLRVEFQGTAPQNEILIGIEYRQYALPADGTITVEDFFSPGPMEETVKTYADITVLQYSGYAESVDPSYFSGQESAQRTYHTVTARYLFWSEGMYLYCLKLPKVYPLINDSDFEEILLSLAEAENLSACLPAG